ncbi:monocarboxylate transporter [Emericellopsis cladophorae]|uniref:Monocarboxylate transporter n=1 Tax=Emericellopsis cladophorae TaxID=2686198 RepID=A0A9P9Y3N1_9HYPO|nr:monocarboxylate transporter [Emericellopsis cladophorae]KAI6782906.1 monocarboxylate transporter [Emericellopsis cladophorae]
MPTDMTSERTQVPWIGSVQVSLSFAMCAVSGRLTDAGWAKEMVLFGRFFAVFGIFVTSLGSTWWHFFLAQGICTGIGLGLAFMPCATVVSTYFRRHRAFALALASTGSSWGSHVFPSIVQYLTPSIGFAWAIRCAAFVGLTICVVAKLLLKPRVAPRKSGIPARPLAGHLADRSFGPAHEFSSMLCAIGLALSAWTAVATCVEMYFFVAFYGFVTGAGQGCYFGALASLTKDPQKMGMRFGMVSTMTAFAVLTGPPTGGALIERMDGLYVGAQVWGGSDAVATAVSVLGSRLATKGFKFKDKI